MVYRYLNYNYTTMDIQQSPNSQEEKKDYKIKMDNIEFTILGKM